MQATVPRLIRVSVSAAGAFAAHRITGTTRRLRAASIDLAGSCRADLARLAGCEGGGPDGTD